VDRAVVGWFGVAVLVVFIRTPELFALKFSHAPLITGSVFLPGLEYSGHGFVGTQQFV